MDEHFSDWCRTRNVLPRMRCRGHRIRPALADQAGLVLLTEEERHDRAQDRRHIRRGCRMPWSTDVNCVGVMGRGIALQFKMPSQENFKAYGRPASAKQVQPGRMFVYESGKMTVALCRINFPTKRHWRARVALRTSRPGSPRLPMKSGLATSGQLPSRPSAPAWADWTGQTCCHASRPPFGNSTICRYCSSSLAVGRSMTGPTDQRKLGRMTRGRAALITLMDRHLRGLLDPFVTLLEIHKLMYFMDVAEEPLKLEFKKGYYGPYSEKLRHVLRPLEGHLISGYTDRWRGTRHCESSYYQVEDAAEVPCLILTRTNAWSV